jgi:co-chaperonin GroES (HSP10)
MKFRPLHDRVLIEILESEEKTSGGIIIQIQQKKNLKKEKLWQ